MGSYAAYWQQQLEAGTLLAFGPVADPAGVWGLGLIEADSRADAADLVLADPTITSSLGTFELHPIDAIVRQDNAASS